MQIDIVNDLSDWADFLSRGDGVVIRKEAAQQLAKEFRAMATRARELEAKERVLVQYEQFARDLDPLGAETRRLAMLVQSAMATGSNVIPLRRPGQPAPAHNGGGAA